MAGGEALLAELQAYNNDEVRLFLPVHWRM